MELLVFQVLSVLVTLGIHLIYAKVRLMDLENFVDGQLEVPLVKLENALMLYQILVLLHALHISIIVLLMELPVLLQLLVARIASHLQHPVMQLVMELDVCVVMKLEQVLAKLEPVQMSSKIQVLLIAKHIYQAVYLLEQAVLLQVHVLHILLKELRTQIN